MILTADKEVALVVMDKDAYIDKCVTLFSDQGVYQECKDLTKSIHNKVIKQLSDLKNSLGQEFKNLYTALFPPGGNSPPVRFYGIPKFYKQCASQTHNTCLCTSTYKLSKFLTKILQRYTGVNVSFVKDSKGLADSITGKSSNLMKH